MDDPTTAADAPQPVSASRGSSANRPRSTDEVRMPGSVRRRAGPLKRSASRSRIDLQGDGSRPPPAGRS
ncbi:hypothetical protein GCM10025783_16660 [Amnibacterium soli]|uniref:Uncharacterized protein n=1 Tax=Amnibacterium soli TaxID=1282736 RepID=A0ABP8Z3D6_9MICO